MVVSCPSCGAEIRVWNPASISVTCSCDTISLLVDENWTDSDVSPDCPKAFQNYTLVVYFDSGTFISSTGSSPILLWSWLLG